MRSSIRPFVALIAALIAASLAPTAARADAKDDIIKNITKLDAAIKSHDAKTLSALYDPDGKFVTEKGEECDQKKFVAILVDPSITVKAAKSNYTSLRDFGDTAVEMGTFSMSGKQHGKLIQIAVKYLCVWVKKNGDWVIVAEQDTNPPTSNRAK